MTDTPGPSGTSGGAAPDWAVLARFLAGESPAAESRDVSEWLASNPADADLLRALDGAAALAGGPAAASAAASAAPEVDVEAALRRVHARIEEAPAASGTDADVLPLRRPAPRVATPGGRGALRRYGGLAAAAVALLAVGLAYRGARDERPAVASAERVIATPVGTRDSVTLPDGSRIVLAPGTRLTVAAGYGGTARVVSLDGEARFAVRHDASRPFRVLVRGAVVRDLGTVFTVRSADSDSEVVAVAVFDGSVALAAEAAAQPPRGGRPPAGGGVVLGPGDRGEVRPDGRVEARRGAASAEDTAWTRGRLVYRGAPLSTVRADLRRWYGVDLRIDDAALAERRITASFEGEPVDRVLEVIGLAVGADVQRSGNTATLRRTARTPR